MRLWGFTGRRGTETLDEMGNEKGRTDTRTVVSWKGFDQKIFAF